MNRWLVIAVVVLSGLGSVCFASAADNSFSIALSQDSGPAGTTLTITGQGAEPASPIDVLWTPWFSGESCGPQPRDAELVTQVSAGSQGTFTATHHAQQLVGYGNDSWEGIIYLAKTTVPGSEITSNYVCFRFTGTASPDVQYFPETGHSVGHGFLRYWQQFGGLPIFGYPITDEMQEDGITVQYFERARFEWHPGSNPARYDVELGLVGVEAAQTYGLYHIAVFAPLFVLPATPASRSDCSYFAATQHNLCGGFRAYWDKFGGLSIFGYPISEEFVQDPSSGVVVQYFERARFEWHPGTNSARYDVDLGLVGANAFQFHHPTLSP